MGIEVTGRIHSIFPTQQVSERFSKREFVVELADNAKYPQTVLFQLTGDRCGQLDEFAVGTQVRIEFSLRGREWKSPKGETKYFNSLDVWKIEAAGAQTSEGRRSRGGSYGGESRGGSGDPRGGDVIPRGDDEYRPSESRDFDDIPF